MRYARYLLFGTGLGFMCFLGCPCCPTKATLANNVSEPSPTQEKINLYEKQKVDKGKMTNTNQIGGFNP